MIHVGIKKLGRLRDSIGHCAHEAACRAKRPKDRGNAWGYTFLHDAVDDHSGFVYSEVLPEETMETASAFIRNALTDNGSCYCLPNLHRLSAARAAVTKEPGAEEESDGLRWTTRWSGSLAFFPADGPW